MDIENYNIQCHVIADVHRNEDQFYRVVPVALKAHVYILQNKNDEYEYLIAANRTEKKDDIPVVCQTIDNKMNAVFNQGLQSMSWNQITPKLILCWQLKFEKTDTGTDFCELMSKFSECLYKSKLRDKFKLLEQNDKSYVERTYMEDVDMHDANSFAWSSSESESEDSDDAESNSGTSHKSDDSSSDSGTDSASDSNSDKVDNSHAKNKILMTGMAGGSRDRSQFVISGKNVNVFRQSDDDDLAMKFAGSLVLDFEPSKAMLHTADRSMLLMDSNKANVVKRLDIETNKVVQDILVDPDLIVKEILPKSKYEQRQDTQDFLGIGKNSLFAIDPRSNSLAKRVDSKTKQYVTPTRFTHAATSSNGHLVVASETGEIRFYNKVGNIARTLIPGLGDPIIGLDVTAQGDYVLATCKEYLLLLSARHPSEPQKLIFEKSCSKDKKPIARQLRLRPEELVQMGIREVSFTPARFKTSEDASLTEMRSIVTSCGPFAIAWNLASVNRNRLYDYKISKMESDVVADNFLFSQDDKVLVALEDELLLVEKKKFKKPSRS